MRSAALIALVVSAAGCADSGHAREARTTYNAALDLREGKHFDAAVRGFTEARAGAGGDSELRFAAAFELGNTLVAWADVASEEQDPQTAADRLRQAVAWFGDAARLRPASEAARNNLEVAVTRLRQLGDQLTEGERSLAARLDRALADQRQIRDQLRQLDAAVTAGAIEPAAVESAATGFETAQRTLNADIGVVGDLAAGERVAIEDTPEDQRTDEQRARLAQLGALVGHVDRARGAGGDVRAAIRKKLVDRAVDRSEVAVASLVRAREQLLDPGRLLRELYADENLLYRETRVIAGLRSGAIALNDDADKAPPEPPPHLRPDRLGARQRFVAERAGELSARLGAVAAAAAPGDQPEAGGPADEQAALRETVARAAPFVSAAVAAMRQAGEHLSADAVDPAVERQTEALINLARALEYFADVRGLIELTWSEQQALVDRLERGDTSAEARRKNGEALTLNRERLERLSILLASERRSQEAAIAAQAGQGGQADQADELEQAKAAVAARFEAAERHRAAALAALASVETGGVEPARLALAELDELRRLFFSVVEHLKDLHRRQGATRDRTAAARDSGDTERAATLGEIASAQTEHAGLGAQIGEALAAQADQASKQPQPGQPDAAERLAAAADEVRQANARMEAAASKLTDATAAAATQSVDLEPPLDDQAAAVDHLAKAIQILEPPQNQPSDDQNNNDEQTDQDQKDQGDQQDQGEAQPQQSDMSQSEVDKRLRAIREREAERRRRGQQRSRVSVEKDW